MTEEKDISGLEASLFSQKAVAYEQVKRTFRKLEIARKMFVSLETRYWFEKGEFEKVDRELAMIDGRYKKVKDAEEQGREKASTKKLIAKLSMDQIMRIAEVLGEELEVETNA